MEEVAYQFDKMKIFSNLSHTRDVLNHIEPYQFHHLGQIYLIEGFRPIAGAATEETYAWYPLDKLKADQLTPFAQVALVELT